jgi:hypothetical protein
MTCAPALWLCMACHHPVDLLVPPVAPHLTLACGPCDTGPEKMLGVMLRTSSRSAPLGSSRVELAHSVSVSCEGTEEGFDLHAAVPSAVLAALPRVPLDLAGRCEVGGREVVFVITLDRRDG